MIVSKLLDNFTQYSNVLLGKSYVSGPKKENFSPVGSPSAIVSTTLLLSALYVLPLPFSYVSGLSLLTCRKYCTAISSIHPQSDIIRFQYLPKEDIVKRTLSLFCIEICQSHCLHF